MWLLFGLQWQGCQAKESIPIAPFLKKKKGRYHTGAFSHLTRWDQSTHWNLVKRDKSLQEWVFLLRIGLNRSMGLPNVQRCSQMCTNDVQRSQIWLICRECRQLVGLAFLVFTWWGSSGCRRNRGICFQEASHPGVNLLPYSPIHVQWGYAPCAVGVCTNNLVFATTLFARHNFAYLSCYPLYFAIPFHCRAAQEHFLFLYNRCNV